MKKQVIIVAGGLGKRMNNDLPKQFLPLRGIPILLHTVRVFAGFSPDLGIIIVLPSEYKPRWHSVCGEFDFSFPHTVISGGDTRFESVKNGLATAAREGLIAIHDGVRPLISMDLIDMAFRIAEEHGTAVPVLPLKETLREISGDDSVYADRQRFRTVQTPQCFSADILQKAYKQPFTDTFTDDATVVEMAGYHLTLFPGSDKNLKITTPLDLQIAEAIL